MAPPSLLIILLILIIILFILLHLSWPLRPRQVPNFWTSLVFWSSSPSALVWGVYDPHTCSLLSVHVHLLIIVLVSFFLHL